jgi:hypothetical protein
MPVAGFVFQVSMQTGGFLPLTGSSLAMKRSFNGTTLMSALGAAGYKTGLFTASDIDGDGMRAFVDSQGYTDVWARPTGDEYDGDAVDAALEVPSFLPHSLLDDGNRRVVKHLSFELLPPAVGNSSQ